MIRSDSLPYNMVEKIEFNAVFGDKEVKAVMKFTQLGYFGYDLYAGDVKGHFLPTAVFGWRYDGHPLELEDIQILLDKIFDANGIDDEGRNFNANVIIPHIWRRDLLTREEYNRAVENSRFFNWRSDGAYRIWNGKAY